MRKRIMLGWLATFGVVLALLSVLLYALRFVIFRDAHHIWIYLLGDTAFIPIDVLVVTLIIHQLLSRREKKTMLNKLNMVIGVFFGETGNELLRRITGFNRGCSGHCPQRNRGAVLSSGGKDAAGREVRVDCQTRAGVLA